MPDDEKKDKKSKALSVVESLASTLGSFGGLFSPQTSPGAQMTAPRVGGAPPMLVSPVPGAGIPPFAQAQPPMPLPPPTVGAMRTGFEFGSKEARTGAVVASGIQNIAEALHKFKTERTQSEVTKAQNDLNMMMQARQEGDQYTWHLFTSDPKKMKRIEKYLKMELPRVETVPTGAGAPVGGVEARVPFPLREGEAPSRGGQVAYPMGTPGPEAQLRAAQAQQQLEAMRSGQPLGLAQMLSDPKTLLSLLEHMERMQVEKSRLAELKSYHDELIAERKEKREQDRGLAEIRLDDTRTLGAERLELMRLLGRWAHEDRQDRENQRTVEYNSKSHVPVILQNRVAQAETIRDQIADLRKLLDDPSLSKYMGPVAGRTLGFIGRSYSKSARKFFATHESLVALQPIIHAYRGGAQTHKQFDVLLGGMDITVGAYRGGLDATETLINNFESDTKRLYPKDILWEGITVGKSEERQPPTPKTKEDEDFVPDKP